MARITAQSGKLFFLRPDGAFSFRRPSRGRTSPFLSLRPPKASAGNSDWRWPMKALFPWGGPKRADPSSRAGPPPTQPTEDRHATFDSEKDCQESGQVRAPQGGQGEGQEGQAPGIEGASAVTPHERYQRLIDLKGELKRAQEVITECEQVRADKVRQLAIADDQAEAALARLYALQDEARRLGQEAKADFDALVESSPAPSPPLTPTSAPAPMPPPSPDYSEAVRFFEADLQEPRDDAA